MFCCLCVPILALLFTLLLVAYRWRRLPRLNAYLVRPFLETEDSVNGSPEAAILAHRGGACEAPENTLAAFRTAKENGAVGVEFDVDFTKDGRAVVIHDSTVDRTTDGSGPVQTFTFDDIRKLDASCKHPLRTKFPNEKIPTLEEVVAVCCSLGLKMYIEIKSGSQIDKTAELLKNLFSTYQLHDKALVCCNFPSVVYKVRLADPKIVTALVWWHGSMSYILTGGKELHEIDSSFKKAVLELFDKLWDAVLPWYMDFVGVPILSCGKELVCRHMMDAWKGNGVSVAAWTVNKPVAKDYFRECLGCPVITDCVRPDTVQDSNN